MSDMRGLFFIIRGGFVDRKKPSVYNEVRKDYVFIGGYNPTDTTNEDWYQVIDNELYTVHCCCGSLEKALRCIYNLVVKYKTKEVFLEKSQENAPKQAGVIYEDHKLLEEHYGEHFSAEISEVVDSAYKYLWNNRPSIKAANKTKNRKIKPKKNVVLTPQKEVSPVVVENSVRKIKRPKRRK